MFAVVHAGGRQVKVAPSDVLRIDRIEAQAGDEVSLGQVLLLRTAAETHIGRPTVEGAEVRAEVIGEQLGDKIRVFFYRRRKNNKKMRGHRQRYTAVRIRSFLLNGLALVDEAAQSAPAAAPEASNVEPEASAAVPEASAAEPEASAAEPEASAAVPEASAAEPEASAAVPEASAAAPEASAAENQNV